MKSLGMLLLIVGCVTAAVGLVLLVAPKIPWHYDEQERCYFLAGDVVVTPDGGEPVEMGQGDFVTFPQGMSCTWKIRKDVRKHYMFG